MLWASSSPWGLLLLLPQRGLGWAVTATFNPSGSRSPILTEGPLSTAAGRDTGPILLSPSAVPSAQSQPSVVTWAAAQMTLQPRQSPSQATGKHPGPQQPSCLLTPQGASIVLTLGFALSQSFGTHFPFVPLTLYLE